MRTLFEIIELVKDGGKPDYEELLYSVIALDALWHFDHHAIHRMAHEKENFFNNPEYQSEESYRRLKAALDKDPKSYVGWGNDPKNPSYQEFRKWAINLADKVLEEAEGE